MGGRKYYRRAWAITMIDVRMKPNFQPARPGISFKNGKLYEFKKSQVIVLQGWPDPRAWVKSRRKGWHHDRKRADTFFTESLFPEHDRPSLTPPDPAQVECPDHLNRAGYTDEERELYWDWHRKAVVREWKEKHSQADFYDQIPPEIRRALLQYSSRRWHLLNLFARVPGAFDLHVSNPALCFALASNWVFHKPAVQQPMRAARSLVRRKQKHLLGWLGFPATDSARKVLQKINPAAVSVESLLYLRDTLQDPERAKILCHLPRLNAGVLRLVNDIRIMPRLTYRLLEDVSQNFQDYNQAFTYRILIDTLRMDRRLGGDLCPARFGSLRRLRAVHEGLTEQIHIIAAQRRAENPEEQTYSRAEYPAAFPGPPYAGTSAIQPLTTPEELIQEGQHMQHCVASYAWDIAQGTEYIYRVIDPVRATLSIYTQDQAWRPGQLLRAANKDVPKETKQQVFQELFNSRKLEVTPPKVVRRDLPEAELPPAPGTPHDGQGQVVTEMTPEVRATVNRVIAWFAPADQHLVVQ